MHNCVRRHGQVRIGDDNAWPKVPLIPGIAVIIGHPWSSVVQRILLFGFGMLPQCCGTTENLICVVWRSHSAASGREKVGKKNGVVAAGMMHDAIICLGILHPHRRVTPSEQINLPSRSTSNFAPLSTNERAQEIPPDACLSRSCRLLAAKPTQRHPTRFNTRTSQYAYMPLPAVSCACKHIHSILHSFK